VRRNYSTNYKEKKMKKHPRAFHNLRRWLAFSAMMIAALLFMGIPVSNNVSAIHPVLVEGNCDSPVPGEVNVAPGTCGDYDGDGRIGTAEDTDGADRIFGTINAALGPGTGAAAGTGILFEGTVTIVTSGRFAETIVIPYGPLTIQAAPGVSADINAVLQGDPVGGNTARQAGTGINIDTNNDYYKIVLRNLTIRNFTTGVRIGGDARVTMDNCRLENNRDFGIRLAADGRLTAKDLRIASTGFRIPVSAPSTPGHAISFEGSSAGSIFHSQITGSFGAAISNTSTRGTGAVRYYEVFLSHNGAGIVNATRESAP
jgi:Right handed beta helix region